MNQRQYIKIQIKPLQYEKYWHEIFKKVPKKAQKRLISTPLYPTDNQTLAKHENKRCLIGLQKGVSKTSKGHLFKAN